MIPWSGLLCQTPSPESCFPSNGAGNSSDQSRECAPGTRGRHTAEGKYSLAVDIQPGERPGITLPSGAQPWDWRPFGALH